MNVTVQEKLDMLLKAKATLDALTEEELKIGLQKVKAEYEYKKALAVKEIQLKNRFNYPVNMIADVARGDVDVGKLRLARDEASIRYEVIKERIRNERSQIEVLRSSVAFDRATYLNS